MTSTSRRLGAALSIATLFATVAAAPAGKHPYGFSDWSTMVSAAPHAVAPDGRTILYEATHGRATGADVNDWYTLDASGSGTRKLTLPKKFHPYGFTKSATELYGSFDVKENGQLATWRIGAKKPTVIATIPRGISAAVIAPDGSRYAVTADPRPLDKLDETRTVVSNDESALYVIAATGNVNRWCTNLQQIGGFAWSPDGTRIATASQSPKIGFHKVTGSLDICTATATQHVASIDNSVLNEIPYPGAGIAWSDGGRELAFLSTTSDTITPDHLWTVPVAGGMPVDRTPDITYSVEALRGDAHGNVWTTNAVGVQTQVGRYTNGKLTPAFTYGSGCVGLPATTELSAAPATLAFAVSDPTHGSEVGVAHGATIARISHVADAQLATIDFGRSIRHTFTSADGTKIESIVTFPAGWNGKPGKFVVLPHGGPEANDNFRLDALARSLAGHGYVVMQPEYRGSTGYGTAHMQAIYQHFGDTAYHDVDAATTEAVAQGWADAKRLAIFGWSAGGFMTSWTVTQTSRYKAAVEGAGITEWLSFIMSSDVQQTDYDASALENGPTPFLQYSAVMFTDKVTTPLLILHGAADQRVPTYQGRELFVLLKERGKTTRMITFPGSPHFPRLWQQRRVLMSELLAWFDRYNP